MKVIAISDLHGTLPVIEEEADILIIAGDIVPLDIQFNKPACQDWLFGEFVDWANALPVERVFVVAGNHDALMETWKTNTKRLQLVNASVGKMIIYLCNESYDYIDKNGEIWTIFGTPYCHQFGNWPFMRSEEILEEKFKALPEEVDIIISHDPPYGVGFHDCILEKAYSRSIGPEHVGNLPLRKQLEKTKFKWLFCGHIHSGDHNPSEFMGGNVVNVSINNEHYTATYEPFITEIFK